MVQEISDNHILALLQEEVQFEKGFRLLVQKYQERLYWHIRRMVHVHEDTDDVLQNTFIKVYRNISKFQHKAKLYTWIYRIATNETITFLNKRKKISTASIDNEAYDLNNQLQADSYMDGDQAQRQLKKAIAMLPEKQQLVFNMRYYDEIPYKEMANILETSVGGLKASYHHAVKKIERFFKEAI